MIGLACKVLHTLCPGVLRVQHSFTHQPHNKLLLAVGSASCR
jgi:hypothetical protein